MDRLLLSSFVGIVLGLHCCGGMAKKNVGRVLLDLGRPKLYRVNLVGGGLIAGLLLVRDLFWDGRCIRI